MKNIWLLQTGTINRPLVDSYLSDAVSMDYMGSSEFEFGAKGKSLRAMEAAAGTLVLIRFENIHRADGRVLLGYGAFDDETRAAYETALKDVIDGKTRTKERTNLREAMDPSKVPSYVRTRQERTRYLEDLTSFWWDIENHIILSFEEDFMKQLPQTLAHSWAKMNDASTAKAPATEPATVQEQAVIKIDGADCQPSDEIGKLMGHPAGYVAPGQTNPQPATPATVPAAGSRVHGKVTLVAVKDKPFVLVQLDCGFTGLLHESQLNGNTRQERNSRLQGLTRNQELDLQVQDVTEKEGKTRISLSERALALSTALSALAVGTDVIGRVQNKEAYGAFIDLGNGLSGLLHVGSLPGNKPAERDSALAALQSNQVVKVRVTKVETIDRKTRIALVLTDLAEEQERTSAVHAQRMEQLKAGAVIKGTVMGTKNGAYLIGLGCGLSGLLSMDEVRKLSKGDHVRVKLDSVEGRDLRLTRKGIA